jgi:hypothetical protein
MLWTAIGDVLSQAVGIAISPIPIVLVILMLVSTRARVNGPAFLVGWAIGAAVVTGSATALADVAGADDGGGGTDGVLVGQLLLGVLFMGLAVKQWRSRPEPGATPATPKLFAAVDQMGVGKAFGLGLAACVANPKNLPLAISAGAAIAQRGLSAGQAGAAVAVFVVIASATVATPVVVYFALGERSAAVLSSWKAWLIANNATVMTVLFAVLGAKMLGTGLGVFG